MELEHTIKQIIIDGFMQNKYGMLVTDEKGHILSSNNAITNAIKIENLKNIEHFFDEYFLHQSFYEELWTKLHINHGWEGRVWATSVEGIIPVWVKVQTIHTNGTYYLFTFQQIYNQLKKRDKVSYLAYNDMLTKLPNRLSFENKIDELLIREKTRDNMFALLFVDLDRFKLINDTFGHSHGDLLLQYTAKRLKSCFPEIHTVFRWGGDEFICLLPFTRESHVFETAERVKEAFSKPFMLKENEIFVTISIGISLYPHNGADTETLLTRADNAMYHAKKEGRNNYAMSRAELHASNFEKINLENMLRKAIERDELSLHYQPQIEVAANKLVAVEALLRWNHPLYGFIPPNEFIPVAEESGLILAIDDWVLQTACKQLQFWENKHMQSVPISINLSAQQFIQTTLPEKIKHILAETEIDPTLLEIEITETMIMKDTLNSAQQIEKIRDMGVRIAIDDFGTGYSSFQYLKNFAVDSLKIDKIFVDHIEENQNAKAIMNSMITLGHDLDLNIIVEGVETQKQLEHLQINQRDIVQGYLFYRPMQIEKINELLIGDTNMAETSK